MKDGSDSGAAMGKGGFLGPTREEPSGAIYIFGAPLWTARTTLSFKLVS